MLAGWLVNLLWSYEVVSVHTYASNMVVAPRKSHHADRPCFCRPCSGDLFFYSSRNIDPIVNNAQRPFSLNEARDPANESRLKAEAPFQLLWVLGVQTGPKMSFSYMIAVTYAYGLPRDWRSWRKEECRRQIELGSLPFRMSGFTHEMKPRGSSFRLGSAASREKSLKTRSVCCYLLLLFFNSHFIFRLRKL